MLYFTFTMYPLFKEYLISAYTNDIIPVPYLDEKAMTIIYQLLCHMFYLTYYVLYRTYYVLYRVCIAPNL